MKNFTPFILIILAAALFYFYAFPQWQKTQVIRTKQSELSTALEQAQELQKIRQELTAKYSAISPADTERISKVVPARYDPVKLVADLNSIATRHGMTVQNVKSQDQSSTAASSGAIQAPPPVEPYRAVEFAFSTEGQYKNFIAFISDIEKSLQLISIEKVTVGSAKKSGGTTTTSTTASANNLSFDLTIKTYWMN